MILIEVDSSNPQNIISSARKLRRLMAGFLKPAPRGYLNKSQQRHIIVRARERIKKRAKIEKGMKKLCRFVWKIKSSNHS